MKTDNNAIKQVNITRIFDAPREMVFKAWSTKEHLESWYAPHGCAIEFLRFDFRTDGIFRQRIKAPDGFVCNCKGVFVEIKEPERIVFTIWFCDEEGKFMKSSEVPNHEGWPDETTVTVTFEELDGKTRLHLHQTVPESIAKQTGAHPSWLEMLGRLSETLQTHSISLR